MCRVIEVSHSGFYDWAERKPSKRAQANQILKVLKAHIQESFHGSDRTYGSPRVWGDLQDWGYVCSENRVARLMSQLGLKARSRRRRQPGDSGVRQEHCIAPNLLDRQFEAIFSFKHALHRHHADGFFGFSIMSASVFFHEQLEWA